MSAIVVRIQSKVEHPFRIVKCQFGFVKARYKELAKNDSQLVMLFNLANLVGVDQLISAHVNIQKTIILTKKYHTKQKTIIL